MGFLVTFLKLDNIKKRRFSRKFLNVSNACLTLRIEITIISFSFFFAVRLRYRYWLWFLRSNFFIRQRSCFTPTYVHTWSSVLFSILLSQFIISRFMFIVFRFTESACMPYNLLISARCALIFSILTQKCFN